MIRFASPILVLVAMLAASCGPTLDLPPPPDLDERLASLREPDAVVVQEIMAESAERIAQLKDDLEQSSFYSEILDLIVQVQSELYNDEGELDLGGVTFPSPNGGVTVDYICDGWDGATVPDEANGNIALNMRLAAGSIAPLVWGTVESCRYPLVVLDQQINALYDGEIAVVFAEALSDDTNPFTIDVTFIAEGTVEIDDESFNVDDVFTVSLIQVGERTRLNRLDLLIDLANGTSFVYSFFADTTQQVRDSVGTFSCNLEARECNSPSGPFSW